MQAGTCEAGQNARMRDSSAAISRNGAAKESSESSRLAAWYDSQASIRRMWAVRGAQALRVIVTLEPTIDNGDVYPAWLANADRWMQELRVEVGSPVELMLLLDPASVEIGVAAEGELVAALSWRDPTADFR